MSDQVEPVIVGAGPVGLAAALFLARQGVKARVVEMRDEPAVHSKALAVNPRTLHLLESTGVTAKMLARGSPIRGACFRRKTQIIRRLSFAGLHPRYPFMLALSQAASERLLAEALEAAGGRVERGLRMVDCRNVGSGVEVCLESTRGGGRETVLCPWLLAADGSRSTARKQLGIDFPGSAFAGEWHLADVPLHTELAADEANVVFLDDGAFLFLLPVVDDRSAAAAPLWRVMCNRPDPLSRLAGAEAAGAPVWTSSFHVAHRVAARLCRGNVYLAGDAAHIHSPVGARGLNLGIEDAWVFSELLRTGGLDRYHALRHPVDRAVVRRVELVSRMASAETALLGLARNFLFPAVTALPPVQSRMKRVVTGLDHDLPGMLPALS
jgi:2-polyprenyl-6-methoxyphenol hydroxylase-like FAD-dependent oxidoreductase